MLVVAATLTACSPTPTPTPTPTPVFASEDEAFAAAEATYRAYNDASNERRLGGPDAHPENYLTGAALEADLTASDYLRAEGLTVTGTVVIIKFEGIDADIQNRGTSLTALVCLDSKNTRVLDAGGTDVTPAGRAEVVALEARMVTNEGALQVEEETDVEVARC